MMNLNYALDNNSYTMFAKSKLTTSPSSKAATTHKPAARSHYPHAGDRPVDDRRFFPRERLNDSPDYALTRERLDYRQRNHTENKHNRHSAVTINPRSKSGASHLNTHYHSITSSLQKKYSLRPQEDRQEKLLMIREERLGKIRQSFALKNRMNG
jgi:hypothetical protein